MDQDNKAEAVPEEHASEETAHTDNALDAQINKAGGSLAHKALALNGLIRNPKVALPADVLRRMENFNEDLQRQQSEKDSAPDAEQNSEAQADSADEMLKASSFYQRARRWTEQLESEKKSLHEKTKRNFRLFVILLALFGAYYFYNVKLMDTVPMAIDSLKARLPYRLDKMTTLTKVEYTDSELRLYVEKKKEALDGLDNESKRAVLSQMNVNASHLCSNDSLHKIIAEGKRILVLLEAEDGSFHREYVVDKCPLEKQN